MKPGNLVWLMTATPIYEVPAGDFEVACRHYTGHIPAVTMGVEVLRVEVNDYEYQGQREPRAVSWSQVLVDGKLVWTKTRLLTGVEETEGANREDG